MINSHVLFEKCFSLKLGAWNLELKLLKLKKGNGWVKGFLPETE